MELGLTKDACILNLSPFPPNVKWGGAIRSEEIFKVIKQLYPKSELLHVDQLITELDSDTPEWAKHDHQQLSDILMLFKDFDTVSYINDIPDAIIFDHPWLWTEVKKLKYIFPNFCQLE